MQDVLTLEDGRIWRRLETIDDAESGWALSRTGVGQFFKYELRQRAIPDGAEPDDYLMLVNPETNKADVALKVGPLGVDPSKQGQRGYTLITGYLNDSPFPEHEAAIEALSDHLGKPLPVEACPYHRPEPAAPGL